MLTILSGLAAGAAHVVAGPDHLAALAPIAVDRPGKAGMLGLRWGIGHGVGVVLVGCLGMLGRAAIDVELLSGWAEFIVGFTLIAVGLWAFKRAGKVVVHTHAHDHDHDHDHDHHNHAHFHVHASEVDHDDPEAHRGHSHAAFVVGLLHGAAGTGHLLGVLPSLALPPAYAAVYLAAYFVAAVGAMVLFGLILGRLTQRGNPRTVQRLMYSSCTLSVLLGLVWVQQAWPI